MKNVNELNNFCVILTGAIDPSGIIYSERNNVEDRYYDYCISVKKYIDELDYPIIFCENSNYPIPKDSVLLTNIDNYEILQYDGQNFPREYGKGYGLMESLNYALENSKFANDKTKFVHITGRYNIKNIKKIINYYINKEFDVSCDLSKGLTYAESRVFLFNLDFFNNYLHPFKTKINDKEGVYFEHVLAMAVHRSFEKLKWVPFFYKPIIKGISGTDNLVIKNNLIANFYIRIKYWVINR